MHPLADLSAYLDGALEPERRREVAAHLEACALCRSRLAELRGTARLLAALPSPAPSRSLIPRVRAPTWLAPLRTLAALGSGLAAVLFVVAAVGGIAPSAQLTSGAGGAAFDRNATEASKAAAPQGAPAAAQTASPSPVPAPNATSLATSFSVASPDRTTADTTAASASAVAVAQPPSAAEPERVSAPRAPAFTPWLWLALAVVLAALAVALHRRLRAA